MPVWQERTKALREAGTLEVVGVVQEQHRERAQLYATWKQYDWPVLWDPFNVTGSKVVPVPVLLDEHGVVRKVGARPDDLDGFLSATFAPPATPIEAGAGSPRGAGPGLAAPRGGESDVEAKARQAMNALLWPSGGDADAAVKTLVQLAAAAPANARAQFRAGVALRLRYDAADARERARDGAGQDASARDFQSALDAWRRALELDPNQYIWRRRIQQYGPRLDKPYPFYTWVEEAVADLRARGVDPGVEVDELTPAERMLPQEVRPVSTRAEPDPEGQITRAQDALLVRQAVAFHSQEDDGARTGMLHLELQPGPGFQWNNEAEPTLVWVDVGDQQDDTWIGTNFLTDGGGLPEAESTDEVRRFSLEVRLPAGQERATFEAYALFYVCGEDGVCLYRRADLELVVTAP